MVESMSPLVPLDVYERHAVHIGTNQKSADMKQFLDTLQQDSSGLHLIDVHQTDARIRIVAKFLSNYEAQRVLVVSARQYGQRPARKFAQLIGAKQIVGRFIPGTLTNSRLRTYIEPEVILVTDPAADAQALSEAVKSGLPVVAICDANNRLRNVDLALPANNKGRRSLALVYWLLAREILKARGTVSNDVEWELSEDVANWESTF
ncbi:MAG: 30S ribosomal protein S2 [Candidatus Thalassarchaeaceae archaeon]|jgi:small subunit ribosomal protein S2|nr:30S ribosomal protein S2 [Euryarchaeota archaeon]MDP6220448.1 30S ribosomal protein S2 [Candidatus Thalassarchaeaceae archaeon]MBV44200.1 30S ribosomal protein S2 [Euryarchaeota archaeon]MDP7091667.1 30S ribosomal protein S2 [Candidatus Thalassarchaeaceae archaeon]MDP7256963.1 30S ribosomal protein S2 [Candidatus Thalassarchaeaceae archaeon]|tara:strand:- start:8596 stop:9213 length:618 start_codon:yes stop_codon:yes gene_type:complete